MITCRELAELLFDLTSDELPADSRAEVEEHLSLCPACLAYQESYTFTIQLTRRLTQIPLPPGLRRQLQTLLENTLETPGRDVNDDHSRPRHDEIA